MLKDIIARGMAASNENEVTEGYYYNNNFYADSAHTQIILGKAGKLYIDIGASPAASYRWNGSAYAQVGGGGGSSLPTYPEFNANKQYVLALKPNAGQTAWELAWIEDTFVRDGGDA